MAYQRVSPGMYRDDRGKLVRSQQMPMQRPRPQPQAMQRPMPQGQQMPGPTQGPAFPQGMPYPEAGMPNNQQMGANMPQMGMPYGGQRMPQGWIDQLQLQNQQAPMNENNWQQNVDPGFNPQNWPKNPVPPSYYNNRRMQSWNRPEIPQGILSSLPRFLGGK